MKKTILILALFVSLIGNSQNYVVLDSTYVQDEKLITSERYLSRLINELKTRAAREKVNTDTIMYFNETRQFINLLTDVFNQYKNQFLKVDTLNYFKMSTEQYQISTGQTINFDYFKDSTGIGLIHEWEDYNKRINQLNSDTTITLDLAKKEFAKIKEKQTKLLNYYNQIKQ